MDSQSDTSRLSSIKKALDKSDTLYASQIILVYIIVIASICNLSIGTEQRELWIALLSSSLGYLLPNPSSKSRHDFIG